MKGSSIQSHKSLWVNRFMRKRATRLDIDQPSVDVNLRYLSKRMAIIAVQNWIMTALTLVP